MFEQIKVIEGRNRSNGNKNYKFKSYQKVF